VQHAFSLWRLVRPHLVVEAEKSATSLLEPRVELTADVWPVDVGVLTQVVLGGIATSWCPTCRDTSELLGLKANVSEASSCQKTPKLVSESAASNSKAGQ